MMRPLVLFEHEAKPFPWSDRDLFLLQRMRDNIGADALRATVRDKSKGLQAAQYVGVVRLRNQTIQILPKVYRSSEEVPENDRAKEATRNLLYMLELAGQLPIREHALAPLLNSGEDWFEILTRLFASHLLEEWQRGAYRTYQSVEDDLPVLKGKWRISAQFKRPERKHIFAVSFDDFSADNHLNRVFRFVVERLWRLTRNSGNRQRLSELREWMDEVELVQHVTVADAHPSHLTRLNQRFAPLLNLARLFLDGGTLQMTAGDMSTFAFVFDMNQLFETFIAEFIRRHRGEILDDQLADCELLMQSRGARLFLAQHTARGVFQLIPDLTCRIGGTFPLLIDTKYKRLDRNDRTLGISQSDIYQMLAYAHRYESPRVVLLYPKTADMREGIRKTFVIERTNEQIQAATVDLRLDMRSKHAQRKLVQELKDILTEQSQ